MLALDHVGSFRRLVNPQNPDSVSKEELIALKAKIIDPLVGQFGGILLDFDHGLPAYQRVIAEKNIKSPPPFLLRIEESASEEGSTTIKYSAKELKNAGAAGVKLLLYFNPEAESAKHQLEIGKKVLEDAHSEGLPLFIEIVIHNKERFLVSRSASTADISNLTVSSIRRFLENSIVPDVWKLEYPGDAKSCRKLTKLVGGTPWILLTRGVPFDVFKKNLKVAVENGCLGFLAGRALWQDLFGLKPGYQETFLGKELPERFRELSSIALKAPV